MWHSPAAAHFPPTTCTPVAALATKGKPQALPCLTCCPAMQRHACRLLLRPKWRLPEGEPCASDAPHQAVCQHRVPDMTSVLRCFHPPVSLAALPPPHVPAAVLQLHRQMRVLLPLCGGTGM